MASSSTSGSGNTATAAAGASGAADSTSGGDAGAASSSAQADAASGLGGASGMYGNSMYGSGMGGMYGRSSMYGGGYGRMGGMGSMYGGYGGGMYGGYGGGMGMGGMGMGMGMGGGSSYADSMFRMTQMLEMNSIMLDQLQEHVSMTYNRLRDVVTWVWALKDFFFKREPPGAEVVQQQFHFESEEAKQEALQRVRRRAKVLLALLGLFLLLVFRDSRRRARDLAVDGAWLKAAEGLVLAVEPPQLPMGHGPAMAEGPFGQGPAMAPPGMEEGPFGCGGSALM